MNKFNTKFKFFDLFKLNEKSKFSLSFWKSKFWKRNNLANIWKFIFTINPYTALVFLLLFVSSTIYMLQSGSDGTELIPISKYLGLFWVLPGVLTYIGTWIYLIIKKQF